MRRFAAPLVLCLSLGLGACQRTKAPTQSPPVTPMPSRVPDGVPGGVLSQGSVVDDPPGEPWPVVSTEFLALAPADTPYVFANLEPVSNALLQRLEPWAGPLSAAFNKGYAKQAAGDASDDALRELLGEKLTMESMRRVGIELNTTFILYGLGIAPVARVRLGDSTLFKQAVDRVSRSASKPTKTAEFHGQMYWYSFNDDGKLAVFAVVGPDLVFAYLPAGPIQRELLPLVFGQQVPAQSLATTRRLETLMADHGLTRNFLSVIDIEGLARTLLGRSPPGLEKQVAQAMGAVTRQDPDCSQEFARLAHAFPRVVFGFEALSAKRIATSTTLVADPAIASALTGMVGPIPGLKSDDKQEGAFAAGVGINMDGAKAAARAFATAMERDPFSCEDLRSVSEAGPQLNAALAMLPAAVEHLTGFAMVVHTISDSKAVDGFALIGADDPRAVLDAMAALAPAARLERLSRPNKPVPVTDVFPDIADADPWIRASRVAFSKRAIGLASGTKGKRDLLGALAARRANDGTLFSGSVDIPRVLEQMPEIWEDARTRQSDPLAAELADAVVRFMGRLTYRLKFTDRGAEFEVELRTPPAK